MKVGHAFGDHIHSERKSSVSMRRLDWDSGQKQTVRWFVLPILLGVGVIILIVRLFFLQGIHGYEYRIASDQNRFRTQLIHAPRGIIFDRNHVPLVYNAPGFRETIDGKTRIISQKEAIDLMAKGDKHLEVDSLRNYPFKDTLGHVIGYIGEISADELKNNSAKYKPGDLIGKMGIEASYEDTLRGVDGKRLVEVNVKGNVIRTLGQTDPIPGQDVILTIDSKLQERVMNAMKDVKKGATIVSTPQGEILAMTSKPTFDPNLFTLGKNYTPSTQSAYTSVKDVLHDASNHPLLNRAIGGTYPPGSTFKLVTAVGGLESRVIDENYTVEDTGILKVGDFSYANWYYTEYGKKEGTVDIVRAIKRSNDIFFYKLGQLLGVDRLSKEARLFGAGTRLGIDIPGEVNGTVPSKDWKKKVIGENWYLGDDFHFGIGQGYLLTTPLQVNVWTQAIANKGTRNEPHLLQGKPSEVKQKNLLSEKNFALIRQGMMQACDSGGVAWPLFNFSVRNPTLRIDEKNILEAPLSTRSADFANFRRISLACKTGTAQHGGEEALPHAWITLFAPAFNPQIVVTVLNESSGEGSNMAAPIAKDILTGWFEK